MERGRERPDELLKGQVVEFCGAQLTLQSQPCPTVNRYSCARAPYVEYGTRSVIHIRDTGVSTWAPHVATCACRYGGACPVSLGRRSSGFARSCVRAMHTCACSLHTGVCVYS